MQLKYVKLHEPIFIPNIDGVGKGLNIKDTIELGPLCKVSSMRLEGDVVYVTVGKTTAGLPMTNVSIFVAINEA